VLLLKGNAIYAPLLEGKTSAGFGMHPGQPMAFTGGWGRGGYGEGGAGGPSRREVTTCHSRDRFM